MIFAVVSALTAGMIGAFHGVFFIPYAGKEPLRETKHDPFWVRLKRRLKTLWARLIHASLKERLGALKKWTRAFVSRLYHVSIGCASGCLWMFLYGLLVFVILVFANKDYMAGVPALAVGVTFACFGAFASAIWRGFLYHPSRKGGVQHRGIRELLSHLRKNLAMFFARLGDIFSLPRWRKYYHWLTDEPDVSVDEAKDSHVIIAEGQEPLPEKVLFKPPILHKRDVRRGAILWSLVILPVFLLLVIGSIVDLAVNRSSSSTFQMDKAFLVLAPLGLIECALVGGFAAGVSKFIYWSAGGPVHKRLFIKIGAVLTLLGFLLTLVEPSVALLQSVSANAILHQENVNLYSIAWSPDGTRIAAGDSDGTIQIWDVSSLSNTPIHTYPDSSESVESVAWSPDGMRIAAGGYDGTIQIWNGSSSSDTPAHTYHYHNSNIGYGSVFSVAWSPDRTHIAVGGSYEAVEIWDTSSSDQQPVHTYSGHSGYVNSVSWSPDGTRIVSGDDVGTVQVWYAYTGDPINKFEAPNDPVNSLSWSPDGTRIAFGDSNGNIQLWKI